MKKSALIRPINRSILSVYSKLASHEKIDENSNSKKDGKVWFKHKLVIPNKNGFQLIPFYQIESLKADSNYSEIRLVDQCYIVVSKSLKSVERQLDRRFFRIHSSTIINLVYLKEVNKGDSIAIMESGEYYSISRNRKKAFLACITNEI